MLKAKLIVWLVSSGAMLAVGSLAVWHYKSLRAERDQLRDDVAVLEDTAQKLKRSLADERTATAEALADRAAARRALDTLRQGRESDPEAQSWGAQPIPKGERERLCAVLEAC